MRQTAANFRQGYYGCSEFQFYPKFPQNWRISSSHFVPVFLEKNFRQKENVHWAQSVFGIVRRERMYFRMYIFKSVQTLFAIAASSETTIFDKFHNTAR